MGMPTRMPTGMRKGMDMGIIVKISMETCGKCGESGSIRAEDIKPGVLGYRCRCGDRTSLLKVLAEEDKQLPWQHLVKTRKTRNHTKQI